MTSPTKSLLEGICKGAVTAGLLFNLGCSPTVVSLSPTIHSLSNPLSHQSPHPAEQSLDQYWKQSKTRYDDPQGLFPDLRRNEYVVPDDVFTAYADAIGKDFPTVKRFATHIDINRLHGKEFYQFGAALSKIDGLSEDPDIYYLIFSTPNKIVLSASALRNKKAKNVLHHERTHHAIDKLPIHEQVVLKQARQDLVDRRYPINEAMATGYFSASELDIYRRVGLSDVNLVRDTQAGYPSIFISIGRWDELYAYLVQGVLEPGVEHALEQEHPRAHEIFKHILGEVTRGGEAPASL